MGDSDIDVTHQGQFLMHDSEELFLNTINSKNLIQFPWKYSKSTLKVDLVLTHLNCCLWSSFGSAQRSVEQLQTFSTTFRSLWKSTVIYWSPCDMFGNSSHDTRWKSHTFDLKKVGLSSIWVWYEGYTKVPWLYFCLFQHSWIVAVFLITGIILWDTIHVLPFYWLRYIFAFRNTCNKLKTWLKMKASCYKL